MKRERVTKGTKEALKRVVANSYEKGSSDDFISRNELELNARMKLLRLDSVSKKINYSNVQSAECGNRGIGGIRVKKECKRKPGTGILCEQGRVMVCIFESWIGARDNHCLALQDKFIATNGLSEFQKILAEAINGPVVPLRLNRDYLEFPLANQSGLLGWSEGCCCWCDDNSAARSGFACSGLNMKFSNCLCSWINVCCRYRKTTALLCVFGFFRWMGWGYEYWPREGVAEFEERSDQYRSIAWCWGALRKQKVFHNDGHRPRLVHVAKPFAKFVLDIILLIISLV